MVSAFEVYLVLQLDSIVCAVRFLAVIFMCIAMISAFLWGLNDGLDPRVADACKRGFRRSGVVAVLALLLAALLPSSRTAAAMILVPALTSKEVVEPVGREAAELYQLAKKALARLGQDEKTETTE